MVNKSIKRIGFICLCLACLSLAGCFHIPDKDWLPSKNKVDIGAVQEDEQVEEALNSFVDGIDMISSQRSEIKNDESQSDQNEILNEELEDNN